MTGAIEGGCQCGRIRYSLARVPVAGAHLCHCRMCQKAVGNAFAALAPVRRDELTWLGPAPEIFRSSSLAERGFCRSCGTPLTFAYIDSARISVTIGSLDDPSAVQPQAHEGVESLLPWLKLSDGLPMHETSDGGTGRLAGMVNHQHRDSRE